MMTIKRVYPGQPYFKSPIFRTCNKVLGTVKKHTTAQFILLKSVYSSNRVQNWYWLIFSLTVLFQASLVSASPCCLCSWWRAPWSACSGSTAKSEYPHQSSTKFSRSGVQFSHLLRRCWSADGPEQSEPAARTRSDGRADGWGEGGYLVGYSNARAGFSELAIWRSIVQHFREGRAFLLIGPRAILFVFVCV